MKLNFYISFLTAAIPLAVGMLWYSKILFGNAWMQASGIKESDPKPNMILVMGLTYLFGLFASVALYSATIHQMGLMSMFQGNPDAMDATTELGKTVQDLVTQYGKNFRTFKHGALHGVITALFLGLPIIAISAMFEKKSWKYIAIHTGYWVVCLGLMGGIICQFA